MSAPLSTKAAIVDAGGKATREFIAYLQNLFSGVIQRTTYTGTQLATMTPTAGATAFCSDSNTTTFNAVVAGGGANAVPVHGDGTDWRVG